MKFFILEFKLLLRPRRQLRIHVKNRRKELERDRQEKEPIGG
jgi:hypothetical protein